jgi:short subunit dehydrogenase-like uncharacterized protein
MSARIVIFAATGFTGQLTVKALVENGQSPLLVGRSESKLKDLASRYDNLDHAVADAGDPRSVKTVVREGDVLVSLAGPFVKLGRACVEAAVAQGAHYLDSTGEPPFIRSVFEQYGPRAKAAGVVLLTAMGYDYVPGNLAAVHALQDAGPDATRVKVGYFALGPMNPRGLSGGTRASSTGLLFDDSFRRENGIIEIERPCIRFQAFYVGGKRRGAVSVGASEHYTLPLEFPQLRSVETYLGWFGRASKGITIAARTAGAVTALPLAKAAIGKVTSMIFHGSSGGPNEELRAQYETLVVAQAFNSSGQQLSRAVVSGTSPYDFTGRMLAWASQRILSAGAKEAGALGPATAFGVDDFIAGARTAGIERVE